MSRVYNLASRSMGVGQPSQRAGGPVGGNPPHPQSRTRGASIGYSHRGDNLSMVYIFLIIKFVKFKHLKYIIL